jgi:hypothetical protein
MRCSTSAKFAAISRRTSYTSNPNRPRRGVIRRRKQQPVKDTRLSYTNERIATDDNVWHIDAKLDPATGKITVSNVYGDVTDQAALDNAIAIFATAELLRIAAKVTR